MDSKLTKFKSLPLFQNLPFRSAQATPTPPGDNQKLTSPHPLHGYASSSPADSGYSPPAATAASGASMAQAASYLQLRAGGAVWGMGMLVSCRGMRGGVVSRGVHEVWWLGGLSAWVGGSCEVL